MEEAVSLARESKHEAEPSGHGGVQEIGDKGAIVPDENHPDCRNRAFHRASVRLEYDLAVGSRPLGNREALQHPEKFLSPHAAYAHGLFAVRYANHDVAVLIDFDFVNRLDIDNSVSYSNERSFHTSTSATKLQCITLPDCVRRRRRQDRQDCCSLRTFVPRSTSPVVWTSR